MQAVVDALLPILTTSSILLEPTATIIANLDQHQLNDISTAFERMCVEQKDRECYLKIAVDTKRGYYTDTWIPTLHEFLEDLEGVRGQGNSSQDITVECSATGPSKTLETRYTSPK